MKPQATLPLTGAGRNRKGCRGEGEIAQLQAKCGVIARKAPQSGGSEKGPRSASGRPTVTNVSEGDRQRRGPMTEEQAIDRASESDRQFFEANPRRHFRIRLAIQRELPGLMTPEKGWAHIVVRQIQVGVRMRLSFVAPTILVDGEKLAEAIFADLIGDKA